VPFEQTIELGNSVEGRSLTLHVLGQDMTPPVILILGAIHGSEPTSAAVARKLLDLLRAQPHLIDGQKVAILPVANPDGLARNLRSNKNLVDLNRNFPAANWKKSRKGTWSFGGDQPASEPETLAILKAFDLVNPARVISIHSMPQPCNNYDGPAAELARLLSASNHYPVKDDIGYPTPGSLGSWAGIDRHIPIITLELPNKLEAQAAWQQNREALLAAIRTNTPGQSAQSLSHRSAAPDALDP
jgi:protein MpaA